MNTVKIGFRKNGHWTYRSFIIPDFNIIENLCENLCEFLKVEIIHGLYTCSDLDKISIDFKDISFDVNGQMTL